MLIIKAKNAQRTFTPERWIYDADMLSDTESIQLFTAECFNSKMLFGL